MKSAFLKFLLLFILCGGVGEIQAGGPDGGSLPGSSSVQQQAASRPNVIQIDNHYAAADSILLKAKPGVASHENITSKIQSRQLSVAKRYRAVPGLYCVSPDATVAGGQFTKEALLNKIEELRATGLFEYVEPDWQVHLLQTPGDPAFASGELWGLRNTGQSGGVAGIDINAVNAWAVTAGSPTVVVGVVDTGIRYTHQDIVANMWVNPNEIPGNNTDDDNNGYVDDVHGINSINGSGNPMDGNNHGTHVAGTIAATANNGTSAQHVGVAYNVKVMALKFLPDDGFGRTSDAIEAIQYGIDHGAHILNNSWGGGGFSTALLDVIQAANNAGILFVAAAGNDSRNNDFNPSYPSNYDVENVISVAAIDRTGKLATFSNYGAQNVDLGAPGVSILSCTAFSNSSYASFQGTSMASPHVAGVAALLVSQDPGATVTEMRNRLLDTTVPLSSLSGKTVTGGMVDAAGALSLIEDGILEIAVQLRGAIIPGNNVTVDIRVSDLIQVTNATVSARFGSSGAFVNFVDDGTGDDLVAGDAVYAARLLVPSGVTPVNLNGTVFAPGKTTANISVDYELSLVPTNDFFNDRIVLLGGTTQTTGLNINATSEAGEPRNPVNAGGKSVWWEWVAPATGEFTITTAGSNYDTTLAIYSGNTLNSLVLVASNDDSGGQQSAVTFAAQEGTSYQIQVDGYLGKIGNIKLNYPSPGGDGSPVIISQPVGKSVLVGRAFSLSVEAIGTGLSYQWYLDDVLIPGATSSIYSVFDAQEENEGSYTVKVTNTLGTVVSNAAYVSVDLVAISPDNDDFINAEVLIGAFGAASGFNNRASGEGGEPNHGDVSSPLASVWWSWKAPADGLLFLNTFGSNFNTILAVYTGSAVNALTLVDSNDDSGSGTQSAVAVNVTEGVTYRIAVDGFDIGEGQISLEYNYVDSDTVPNDHFADRTLLPSASTSAFGVNVGATGETGEPNHGGNSAPLGSVWWSWTAPADGQLSVTTDGSTFNTLLAVYQGTALNNLDLIASNDDASFSDKTSQVFMNVVKGQTYEIAVDGFLAEEGAVVLTLELSPDDAKTGRILLVEDQAGFGDTTQMLFDLGYNVTVAYNNAILGNVTLQNANFLSQFKFLVYGARGISGSGDEMSSATKTALENYIQEGGHLLVTGYDTLGSPTDTNLAELVRASNPGDLNSNSPHWKVSIIKHPILNGPHGDFRGMEFTATGYDDDQLVPDTSRGAVELISSREDGSNGKLIFTELPGSAGSVGYWNGGLSGTTTDAQPDFNDGGNPQSIFMNYVDFALSGAAVEGAAIEIAINHGSPILDGSSLDLGSLAVAQSVGNTITIRNVGLAELNNIALSAFGNHAGDISFGSLPSTSLLPGHEFETSFSFAPQSSGARQTEIRIGSSDAQTPTFNLFIEGVGLANTDGDLASDNWEWFNGFDPSLKGDVETLDSDGDGDRDIMEIFQGTDRNLAGEKFGPQNPGVDAGNQQLSTTLRRSTTQTSIMATHLWSRDLVNWYSSGQSDGTVTVTISETPIPVDGQDYEFVDVDIQITNGSSDSLFYQLFLTPRE